MQQTVHSRKYNSRKSQVSQVASATMVAKMHTSPSVLIQTSNVQNHAKLLPKPEHCHTGSANCTTLVSKLRNCPMWRFPKIRGTPKSSILMGFSLINIINHLFMGYLHFRKPPCVCPSQSLATAGLGQHWRSSSAADDIISHGCQAVLEGWRWPKETNLEVSRNGVPQMDGLWWKIPLN